MSPTHTRQDENRPTGDPPLLRIRNLSAGFEVEGRYLEAVDRVSFDIPARTTVGLVGESGCGKSVTAMSILRLLPQPSGRISSGEILFAGRDLGTLPDEELRHIRGDEISMIFQEPMTALNPLHTVGRQIQETLLLHHRTDSRQARERVIEMLREVGIPAPEDRFTEYPHQLSGGMRQRIMIAMALICSPRILLADEPTTALDVTTQAQILDLLQRLRQENGLAVLMITHDLGVIAETCDEVVVMYAGRIVEKGPTRAVLDQPLHRYTEGLLKSIPAFETTPKTPLPTIPGQVPGLDQLPMGARFAPRCLHPDIRTYLESDAFREVRPDLVEVRPGHWVEDCPYVRT